MTCIAAVAHQGKVYMGGDSAGVNGWDLVVRKDEKVFHNGEFLIGFTTSFRMGQLLRYAFTPPPIHDDDLPRYMAVEFVNGVRECLKAGGYARKDAEAELAGNFLVGIRGRLFNIDADYHAGETSSGYDAVGCGLTYAKGALYATAGTKTKPEDRVLMALRGAEQHCAGVRGPFVVLGPKSTARK